MNKESKFYTPPDPEDSSKKSALGFRRAASMEEY
jgi:hypothetical protein